MAQTTLILGVLLVSCFANAASHRYLSIVGPAPLRFEKTRAVADERATMTPYTPSVMNPGQESIVALSTNDVASDAAPLSVSAVDSTRSGSEPDEQTSDGSNQVASAESSVHTITVNSTASSEPLVQGVSETQTNAMSGNVGSEEPAFQAAPMTPQMLMYFFQNRGGRHDQSETGVFMPMTFTPPQMFPPNVSKATYQVLSNRGSSNP